MNRAVRRKQAKQQAKPHSEARAAAPRMPATAPSAPRAAPAKRERVAAGGGILSWRPRFVMDIVNELRKVVWPTRDDVAYLTVVVVIIAILFGAALGAIDIGFGWLVDNTLLR
jgi:preprotein translocase subunit SecE